MDWQHIVEKVKPYVVKIETPSGHGTGFLCFRNKDSSICGIATAAHVVEHSHEWQESQFAYIVTTQQAKYTTPYY